MKTRAAFWLMLFVLALAQLHCRKSHDTQNSRSFYMAATPWPADFTPQAVDEAYAFINDHCDMVSHHFDEGIPYQEAWSGGAWPQALRDDVAFRKAKTAAGKTIFLSVAPLNISRREKADYYTHPDGIPDSIRNYWTALPQNDPKVVTAYVRYVSYLIDNLNPSFVNYGVESNSAQWDAAAFARYKDFLTQAYAALKSRYPQLPFFVSFMVDEAPAALSHASELLSVTDYITLSSYPYAASSSTLNGNTDPKLFPSDFFTRYINLDPARFAGFAETGYIAQNLSIPSYALNRQGRPEWQRDYLDIVLRLCQERKAKFLIWFCSADYDAGNERLRQMGLYQDLFGLWQDIGFIDENKTARPARALWLDWITREKR